MICSYPFFSSERRGAGNEPGEVEQMSTVFGQSSGVNGRLHQRWTAAWETQTRPSKHGSTFELSNRTVKKSVRRYQEDMQTVLEVSVYWQLNPLPLPFWLSLP